MVLFYINLREDKFLTHKFYGKPKFGCGNAGMETSIVLDLVIPKI